MESFLDADRAARLEHLRADRIDLVVKPITVVVTASGAPGTGGAAARAARERRARGAARRHRHERALGRPAPLRRVPPRPGRARIPAFPDAMREVAEREGADAILPQSSFDLEGLAGAIDRFDGIAVLVSPPDAIRRSNDKAETYALLHRLGLPAPEFRRVRGAREVEAAARELGYPERPVCFKPVFSSGSRGFRILDPTVDRAHQLLHERPGSVSMRLEEAVEMLASVDDETELLVMELATGGERTIDGIANGREIVLGHPKTREAMRAGLAMYFVTLDDDGLMELARQDRRRARDRALLQHPARRRARDRDQPADLDDRLPGGPEPAVPRRQARARRDLRRRAARAARRASARAERPCATSTSSNGTRDGVSHARNRPSLAPPTHGDVQNLQCDRPGQAGLRHGFGAKFVTNDPQTLRVTHCPVNVAGIPWENVQALRRKGRRRAARRLRARPAASPRPTGRSTGAARFAAAARDAVRRARAPAPPHRRLPLLLRAHARAEVAPVPDPARDRQEERLPLPRLGHPRQDARRARLRQARRRRDRRLLRRDPLGARGARRPAGARPAPVHAAPAVRQPAAARRPRAVEPREEGHART